MSTDLNDFYSLFNGKENIVGTNVNWIRKQISILTEKGNLTADEEKQLVKYRLELGLTPEGSRKPKVCWQYVHQTRCEHAGDNESASNRVIASKWHPGEEERIYLKNKN